MNALTIYGDSILRGVTYSEEKKAHTLVKSYQLPTLLQAGYTVKNRSRMGATISRGLELFRADLAAGADYLRASGENGEGGKKPAILFEFGGNDCDFDWRRVAEDPNGEHLPHTPEEVFIRTYSEAIEAASGIGACVMLSSLTPIDPEKYLSWISRDGGRDEILSWLGDVTMLYRYQEHYNRIVEDLARRYGCPLVDTRERFLLSHSYKDLLSHDGIHPTEEGHALIERTLLSALGRPATA